ncbi:TonB family protein [Rheinheimera sp. A13L]|nr:TonB family protein [Rheinheimera sp. A13L]
MLFFLVLMLHLSLVAAVVTNATEPQAKAVEKAIEGVIISAPAAPVPDKPKPRPVLSEQLKKPKPIPPKHKKAEAKKAVAKPKPAPVKPAPVAEASPTAVSTPEPLAQVAQTKAVPETPAPEPQTSPPVASASKVVNKAPLYPMLSRRLKEQGTVYLQVLVLKNGKVGQLTLKQSSGFSRLDQSALNTVRSWTYQPALKLGQPIDFWFVQPVVFNLNSIN